MNKYLNDQKPLPKDQVIGRDKSGRPVGGQVLELNHDTGEALVSPPVHTAVWARVSELVPVGALKEFLGQKEAKVPAQQAQQQAEKAHA